MKGLKIIPTFLVLIGLSYVGVVFVQANSDEVVVRLGAFESRPMAVGFMVLTSVFVGMVLSGLLCSIEMLALYVQNRKLRKKIVSLGAASKAAPPVTSPASDLSVPKSSGRFT